MKNKTDEEQKIRASEARLKDLTRYIPKKTGVKDLSLGKWYATKDGIIYKIVAKDPYSTDLTYLAVKIELPAREIKPTFRWLHSYFYENLFELPRNRKIDYLKKYIYEDTYWNNLIKILYKNTTFIKDIVWAPCIYAGKGALQKPRKELMSDD